MIPKINHRMLTHFMDLSYNTRQPLLMTAAPGVGKTRRAYDYARDKGVDIMFSHPVIDEPSDYKGLAAKSTTPVVNPTTDDDLLEMLGMEPEHDLDRAIILRDIAVFLPFGMLLRAIEAKTPLIWMFDDLGQAHPQVQAAIMQVIGDRTIGGHKISDEVRFFAATNRREDKAGVKGLLEPLKSRFGYIIELVMDLDSWIVWATNHNIYSAIIEFVSYTPKALHDFKPNTGLENSPNPRLWEKMSDSMYEADNLGLNDAMDIDGKFDMLSAISSSCVGQEYGELFGAFLKVYKRLPKYESIVADWEDRDLDDRLDVRYAIIGMLANQGKAEHSSQIFGYMRRLAKEYQILFMRMIGGMKSPLVQTKEAILWTSENMGVFL